MAALIIQRIFSNKLVKIKIISIVYLVYHKMCGLGSFQRSFQKETNLRLTSHLKYYIIIKQQKWTFSSAGRASA